MGSESRRDDIRIATSSFITKNQIKSIPRDGQEELWGYMTGIAKNLNVNVLAIDVCG